MAHMQISTETSTWLLQAKDFLVEAPLFPLRRSGFDFSTVFAGFTEGTMGLCWNGATASRGADNSWQYG